MRSIVLVLTFVVAALAAPDPFGYPDFGKYLIHASIDPTSLFSFLFRTSI